MTMEWREEMWLSHWLIAFVEISPRWLHYYDLFLVYTVISALMMPQLCCLFNWYISPIEVWKKGIEVSIVSLINGMVAVLMNLLSTIHGWVWHTSCSHSRADWILFVSGRNLKCIKIELSMAISMSLFLTAIPLAQLPNNLISIYGSKHCILWKAIILLSWNSLASSDILSDISWSSSLSLLRHASLKHSCIGLCC